MRTQRWLTRTGATNALFALLTSGARSAFPPLSIHAKFGRLQGDTFTPGDLGPRDA
jgi:hypothetical protein